MPQFLTRASTYSIGVSSFMRPELLDYFEVLQWHPAALEHCVELGMRLAAEKHEPFTWLTCTNEGAAEVCRAALRNMGFGDAELAGGYLCDPTTKSDLRILARPGIIIRLSRNLDKQRGFVTGAVAIVCESLQGNAVFTARLQGSNNMVLVHPIEEGGQLFLPCCYGYATTIRRAQGSSLTHGCIWFDHKYHPAGRGYGYVAVSRFRSRAGCHVFGKLRRSDFLPVGEPKEDEVLERGYESRDSDVDGGTGMEYMDMYASRWVQEDDTAVSDEDLSQHPLAQTDVWQ